MSVGVTQVHTFIRMHNIIQQNKHNTLTQKCNYSEALVDKVTLLLKVDLSLPRGLTITDLSMHEAHVCVEIMKNCLGCQQYNLFEWYCHWWGGLSQHLSSFQKDMYTQNWTEMVYKYM